VQDGTLQEVM